MKRFCVYLKFSKILFQERVGSRTHHYLSRLNMVFKIHVQNVFICRGSFLRKFCKCRTTFLYVDTAWNSSSPINSTQLCIPSSFCRMRPFPRWMWKEYHRPKRHVDYQLTRWDWVQQEVVHSILPMQEWGPRLLNLSGSYKKKTLLIIHRVYFLVFSIQNLSNSTFIKEKSTYYCWHSKARGLHFQLTLCTMHRNCSFLLWTGTNE